MNLGPGGEQPIMKDGWFLDAPGRTVRDQLWTMKLRPKPMPKDANPAVTKMARKQQWEAMPENWEWQRTPRGIKDILMSWGLWRDGLNLQRPKPDGVKSVQNPCQGRTDCCARTLLAN